MLTSDLQLAADTSWRGRVRSRFGAVSPEAGDAFLYGLSAIFAVVTIVGSSLALYRQWAELALGPFIFGTVASGILAVVSARRGRSRSRIRSRSRSWLRQGE